MNIKLVIADVDGTLVTKQKILTAETCAAVARLRSAGIEFAVTSGRPPRGMASLVGPLRLTRAIAAFNGGVFVKPDLTTVLARRTIPAAVGRAAVDRLLQAGLDVWVYQGNEWFIRRAAAPRVAREASNVGFAPTLIGDLHEVLEDAIKIVGVSLDTELVARAEAELGSSLGPEASASRSTPFYVDVTHPEANKGMVAREASRLLRIPLAQIATIGDMPNDVPMLTIAGMGIAMGNATEEVQRIARHVTRSNDEDGFAHAVDAFILGEPPTARTLLGLPPRTRACLFGLGGVLIQSAVLHADAWKQLFDDYLARRSDETGELFVPFDPIWDYAVHFEGKLAADGVRSFLDSRGIEVPEPTIGALVDRKGEILVDWLTHEHVRTYEGSVRYLRAARSSGLRTAVVTSSRYCREALASAGLSNLFDARIDGAFVAAEHLHTKPMPDAYLAAVRALGVEPEQTVLFDDELAGMEAGRAGHFGYVVGIDRADRARDLQRHGADVVVPDLTALVNGAATVPL
jgi:Cof subfamily protein (haloacid dehalogenase superfamily)/HAD superfamily hydrolase (TIGR01509 family)